MVHRPRSAPENAAPTHIGQRAASLDNTGGSYSGSYSGVQSAHPECNGEGIIKEDAVGPSSQGHGDGSQRHLGNHPDGSGLASRRRGLRLRRHSVAGTSATLYRWPSPYLGNHELTEM